MHTYYDVRNDSRDAEEAMEGTKYDLVFCDTRFLTTLGVEETDFKETPGCSSRIELNEGGNLFPREVLTLPFSFSALKLCFNDRTAPQSSGGGWERDGVWQISKLLKGSETSILQKLPLSETLYKDVEMSSIPTAK